VGTALIVCKQGPVLLSCEEDKKPSDSLKDVKFAKQMSDYRLLKK
jgi:hypothetical protein